MRSFSEGERFLILLKVFFFFENRTVYGGRTTKKKKKKKEWNFVRVVSVEFYRLILNTNDIVRCELFLKNVCLSN